MEGGGDVDHYGLMVPSVWEQNWKLVQKHPYKFDREQVCRHLRCIKALILQLNLTLVACHSLQLGLLYHVPDLFLYSVLHLQFAPYLQRLS